MDNLTLKLLGMGCASCASSIEKAIQSVSGVTECQVNFGAEQATVQYNPQQTDLETIQAAVADAGYQALPLQEMNSGQVDEEKKSVKLKPLDLLGNRG